MLSFFVFLLRIAIGFRLLFPGLGMIAIGRNSDKPFLEHTKGPLSSLFQKMASSAFFDIINKWALFLSGLFLIVGIATRLWAGVAVLLMAIYYLAKFPDREGVVDENIVEIVALLVLIVADAGIFFGIDGMLTIYPFISMYHLGWIF